jgi:putative flippase GtrA
MGKGSRLDGAPGFEESSTAIEWHVFCLLAVAKEKRDSRKDSLSAGAGEYGMPVTMLRSAAKSELVRQYAKFCVIGGICFVVDASIHYFLMFRAAVGGHLLSQEVGLWLKSSLGLGLAASTAAFGFFKVFSTLTAIVVGFVLNSAWTFKDRLEDSTTQTAIRYTLVALSGFLINLLLSSGLYNIVPGHAKQSWAAAILISTCIVSIWNFVLQRSWTFSAKALRVGSLQRRKDAGSSDRQRSGANLP